MFPIMDEIIGMRNLSPGTYDLWDFAPKKEKDDSVKASISHYTQDPLSWDYRTRALVFGNESARISGQVVVNQDGSKTFKGVEIRPFDTDFNFERKTNNKLLERARAIARKTYDPEDRGISYEIRYHGTGRVYHPFTASQLSTALRSEFIYPGNASPGLLPSVTDAPPPYLDQHLKYLDQTGGSRPLTPSSAVGAPATRFVSPADRNAARDGIANWIAAVAGVDPANPMQPAPQLADRLQGIVSNEPMPDWPFPPPIFNRR
jgi:hypothetical protein